MSGVVEKLQDAIEKGDILELEEVINEAKALRQPGTQRSVAFQSYVTRAENDLHSYLSICKSYLRPLRRACEQLSERDIFDALLRIHNLPSNVQLHMYADIRRAETLREDIIAAQEEAIRVLDCDNWRVLDTFLAESACVLENRTVLALVQKREDLIKRERRKVSSASSPAIAGPPSGASPLSFSSLATPYWRAQRQLDANERPADTVSSHNLTPRRNIAAATSEQWATPKMASSRSAEAAKLPASNGVASPPSASSFQDAQRAEADARTVLEQEESNVRKHFYTELIKLEALDNCLVYGYYPYEDTQCTVFSLPLASSPSEKGAGYGEFEAFQSSTGAGIYDAGDATLTEFQAAAAAAALPHHTIALPSPRGDFSAIPVSLERKFSSPNRLNRVPSGDVAAAADEDMVAREWNGGGGEAYGYSVGGGGAARKKSVDVDEAVHRLQRSRIVGRDTPNVSPIRDSTGLTMMSDAKERGAPWTPSIANTPSARLRVPDTPLSHVFDPPNARPHRESVDSTLTPTSEAESLLRRRHVAKLRAVVQEEDIHRKDVEGTEDFDRNVFLNPMAARISMLHQNLLDQQSYLLEY